MTPKLHISDLPTENLKTLVGFLQDNFASLESFFKGEPFLNGEFRHYELVFTVAVTDYKFQHRMSFIPKDIIQTFLTEGVTLTWAYDDFDRTNIKFTTSAPCTVRFFVGRYQKGVA